MLKGQQSMAGRFIVFEGIDGSGKTTQVERLSAALKRMGRRVHATREPTSGPIGGLLRLYLERRLALDPRTLPYLFAADRADHVYNGQHGILAALEAGVDVICDRYVLSTLAYQAEQAPIELIERLNAEFPAPDLTLFLQVDPQLGLSSKARQRVFADVTETLEQQRRVALHFAEVLERHGEHHRVQVLDATALGIEGCAAEVMQHVTRLLDDASA